MWKKITFSLTVATMLTCTGASAADSPSDLLEQGIYTEETVGDLDTAIAIYEKVISQAKANRQFVAQAQLRLGKCLLKQGKTKKAQEAFRSLVEKFKDSPDLEELVAKARDLLPDEASDMKLEPVPWVDGEHLELRIKLGGGLEIGDFILSARSDKVEGREVWDMRLNRNIMINPPNLGLSHVLADRETFRPISSVFDHTLMGKITGDYTPNKVAIRTMGTDGKESAKKMDLDGVHYDNEQGWHLFRRLPLAEGYKGTTPICVTFAAGPMELDVEVTGIETLEVPAGKFECYKLFIKLVQQNFWISTDEHRYVVKFEAGGVTGELQSIRTVKSDTTIEYTDEDLGFSVTTPADWYFVPVGGVEDESATSLAMVDPGAQSISMLHVGLFKEADEKDTASADKMSDAERKAVVEVSEGLSKHSLRAWAESKIEGSKKAHKNFQVVEDSWQERTVGGHPAVSCMATLELVGKPWVSYTVFVRNGTTEARFEAQTADGQMDAFRPAFDKIIDTYKVK